MLDQTCQRCGEPANVLYEEDLEYICGDCRGDTNDLLDDEDEE